MLEVNSNKGYTGKTAQICKQANTNTYIHLHTHLHKCACIDIVLYIPSYKHSQTFIMGTNPGCTSPRSAYGYKHHVLVQASHRVHTVYTVGWLEAVEGHL